MQIVVHQLLAFGLVSVVVIVTPGPDTALTIRNTLLGGRAAGVGTAAGVAMGQSVWTLAASAGVAALLVASEPVFIAIRILGAAYLVILGLRALRDAIWWRAAGDAAGGDTAAAPGPRLSSRPAFRQGFLSDLGNPKMAVFFTSLLPQFAPHHRAFVALLALGLLFCALTFAWLVVYATVVARAGDLLRRPRVRRALDATTGAALVALGARLATERR
jgi:threonine/homoserine/homoserine lactone efflux protein